MKRSDCIFNPLDHIKYNHFTVPDGTHMFRIASNSMHSMNHDCVCGPKKVLGPGIYPAHKEIDNIYWVHK